MKTSPFRSWITTYLINFIQSQLAITTIALPILVNWGLGFSWMSIIGNLIFAPILMLFLMLSAILLVTHILGIPNALVIYGIETITAWWLWALEHGSPSWVHSYAQPPLVCLAAIPLAVWWLMNLRSVNTVLKRCMVFCSLIALLICICSIQLYYNKNTHLTTRFADTLYAIKLINQPSVIIIDNGFFSRKKTVEKVIDYEIKPWLAKQYGTVSIKEVRINKPSYGAFKAAQHLCDTLRVHAVWLPFFETNLSKGAWRAFFVLKEFLNRKNIRFVRYQSALPNRL